ncbi:hypothetical protein NQ314_010403 [Rhamnusium bicolor]|uniref:Uncharacterized protein n=1 Tax=Rhamnusium bicolor TaxID=1586634 RepID=A0AAV8XT41_9CUCU|nr:hypothetical protein NQ314_010403 [Rhamnusium bicolor]
MPTLEGDLDFCEAAAETEIPALKQSFRIMGFTKCPMSAKNTCATPNNKLSIAQFKDQLGIGMGTTVVKLEVEHDTGKTCAEISSTISRARKG